MNLDGEWRARRADDDLRREAVGLDHDDSEWDTVAVPGHWQSSPAFATSDGPLLYRHRFELDAVPDGRRQFVTLDGVFYQADVWLDGAYLGDPEGYFFPHTFEITGLSRLGSEHVLAVEVACAPQRDRTAKRNITGLFQHWDCADPAWNPGGLWRSVHVHTTGPVRIDRLRVLCRDVNETRAHLRLRARLDAAGQHSVVIRTLVDGVEAASQETPLAQGTNEVAWTVDVEDPRLWWPWSMGDPAADDGHRRGRRRRAAERPARRAHRPARGGPAELGVLDQRRADVHQGGMPRTHPDGARRGEPGRGARRRRRRPRRRGSTSCASSATSAVPSCTTPPTSWGCWCGRTSRCSGSTPARSASRPCARPARPSTCSATTRRSSPGARTTSRWRSTTIAPRRSVTRPPSTSSTSSCRRGTRASSIAG